MGREQSARPCVETLEVVGVKSQVLLEPPAGSFGQLHVVGRKQTLVKGEAGTADRLVVGPVWLVNFVVDPVVSGESVLVVLSSFALASIKERLVENDTAEAVSYLEGADVRNFDAEILASAHLIGVPSTGVLYLVAAVVFGGSSAREHRHFEVIDFDFGDYSVHVVHREGSYS